MTHTKPKADKARIKVMAINEKTDGKQAKFLEKFLNHEYKRYGEIVESIILARKFVEECYAVQTPNGIWDRILDKVVKFDIEYKLAKKK